MDDLVVVDVGASGGIHRRWKNFAPGLKAVLFEPDEEAYQRLLSRSDPGILVENAALHEQPGEQEFYICRKQEVSSVYKPNFKLLQLYPQPERFDIVKTAKMHVTCLDQFFQDSGYAGPHFIKLDTQGSELPILRGGVHVLQQVLGVETEVSHVPVYEDAPLFPEVDEFMRSQGFQIYDLTNYYWKRWAPGVQSDSSLGELTFSEILYFRSPEAILESVASGVVTLEIAIKCYLAYGYTHMAQVLVALALSKSLVDERDQDNLGELIRRFKRSKAFSGLPGASKFRSRASYLTERLFPWFGWASKSKSDVGSRYGLR